MPQRDGRDIRGPRGNDMHPDRSQRPADESFPSVWPPPGPTQGQPNEYSTGGRYNSMDRAPPPPPGGPGSHHPPGNGNRQGTKMNVPYSKQPAPGHHMQRGSARAEFVSDRRAPHQGYGTSGAPPTDAHVNQGTQQLSSFPVNEFEKNGRRGQIEGRRQNEINARSKPGGGKGRSLFGLLIKRR